MKKPVTYQVEMLMIGSGVLVNYYQGEIDMCLSIAESLRRGRTGGRILELPLKKVVAEWEPDSTEIRIISS